MQQTKIFVIMILCAVLLSACSGESQQILETFPTVPKVTYETVPVELGTFCVTRQCNASIVYPDIQFVRCGYEGAILKEDFKLSRQAQVKAGDLLATVYFDVSQSQLQKLELDYSEARRALKETSAAYEARIAQYDSVISKGGTAGEIAVLQKKQARNEYRLYLVSAEADVEAKRLALAEYRDRFSEKTIIAPADGVVDWSGDYDAGAVLGENTVLFTYYTESYALLQVDNPSANLLQIAVPGTPVTITDNKITIEGEVVTSPAGVDTFGIGGSVFIVSDNLDKLSSRSNYKVTCQGARIENVMLLTSKAVHTDGDIRYVFVLENGVATRRNVICGLKSDGIICILDGLEPGQQVILNQGG